MSQNEKCNYYFWLQENSRANAVCATVDAARTEASPCSAVASSSGATVSAAGAAVSSSAVVPAYLSEQLLNCSGGGAGEAADNLHKLKLRQAAMETDVGICIGMSNVNLNSEKLFAFASSPNYVSPFPANATAHPPNGVTNNYYFYRKLPIANYLKFNNYNLPLSQMSSAAGDIGEASSAMAVATTPPYVPEAESATNIISRAFNSAAEGGNRNAIVFNKIFSEAHLSGGVGMPDYYQQPPEPQQERPNSLASLTTNRSIAASTTDFIKRNVYDKGHQNSNKYDLAIKNYKTFKLKATSFQSASAPLSPLPPTTALSSSSSLPTSPQPPNYNELNYKISQIKEEYKNLNKVITGPPKKKWIRHYFKEEPILNGHSINSPLVVISSQSTTPQHHQHPQQQQQQQQPPLHPHHFHQHHLHQPNTTHNQQHIVNQIHNISTNPLQPPPPSLPPQLQLQQPQQMRETIVNLPSSPVSIDLSIRNSSSNNININSNNVSHINTNNQKLSSSSSPSLTVPASPTALAPSSIILASVAVSGEGNNSNNSSSCKTSNGMITVSSPKTATLSPISLACSTNPTLTIHPLNSSNLQANSLAADDMQSSLNLSNGSSTSGYNSANASLNASSSSNSSTASAPLNCILLHDNAMASSSTQLMVPGRRRTTSTNSNGAGTREVHNKLEKNRRAHLKECFEQLKKQLPILPDEKKTSNLSVLSAAIRQIRILKQKEREYEHEMERLAKEKIASQNRIVMLKRDLDTSKIMPDTDIVALKSFGNPERDDGLISCRNANNRYNAIAIATSSAVAQQLSNMSPTMSPIHTTITSSSPPNTTILSSVPPSMMPLSLIASNKNNQFISNINQNGLNLISSSINNPKLSTSTTITSMPPGMSVMTAAVTTSTNAMPQYISANGQAPLNFSAPAATFAGGACLQIIGTAPPGQPNVRDLTGKNGFRQTELREMPSQPLLINSNFVKDKLAAPNTVGQANEPPAKVYKLVNGNRQLTLSQVVNNNSLVVSPIQLLTSPQGLRVIGQVPNGLATIELASPNSNIQHHRHSQVLTQPQQVTTQSQSPAQSGAQLHKLLVSGGAMTTPTNINYCSNRLLHTTNSQMSVTTAPNPELSRLPGGAELNILTSAGHNTALYRQGKYIVNSNSIYKTTEQPISTNRAVHVVTPMQSNVTPNLGLTPIMVQQQGHILATTQQLPGKVVNSSSPISQNVTTSPINATYLSASGNSKQFVGNITGSNGMITNTITTSASVSVAPSATINNNNNLNTNNNNNNNGIINNGNSKHMKNFKIANANVVTSVASANGTNGGQSSS